MYNNTFRKDRFIYSPTFTAFAGKSSPRAERKTYKHLEEKNAKQVQN